MILSMLLTQVALADAPPGAKVAAAGHDCVFYVGPKSDIGYNHVNVECYWPEVTVAKADPIMSNYGIHNNIFGSVSVSDVVGTEGEYTRVHQVHNAKGIKPREAMLMFKKEVVSGGYKYSWVMDENQPAPTAGHVTSSYDDGHFVFTNNPSGGVKVEYHLLYSPSGRVPKFVVNWFQTDGVVDVMRDLRAYLGR
jgi:hypothetical protein